jgi:cysteinyl-tRNA synthetase
MGVLKMASSRAAYPLLAFLFAIRTTSFTLTSKSYSVIQARSQWLVYSSNDSEDWYSDYSPQAYKEESRYESNSRSTDQRGGQDRFWNSGGGGSGGGRGSSDRYGRERSSGRGGDRGRGGRGGGRGRFGSSGGGGGGNRQGYERDTSMDDSNIDVGTVERLIGDRTAARRANDFGEADRIRDELLNTYGVQIWDREGIWRTGCSASGSGNRRPGGGGRDGGDRRGGGREFGGRGSSSRDGGRRQRPPKDFGPTGHDYSMSPDAGPISAEISEAEIDDLIASRLQAKMSRDFDTADRIQSVLTNAGVYVHDGLKEWRADGIMFGDYANGDRPGRESGSRRSEREAPYAQSPYSIGIDVLEPDQIVRIETMVSRRAGAKQSRNFRTADSIRNELRDEFNVFIDDRLRQWTVGGDFGPNSPGNQDKMRPWSMSVHSEPVTDESLVPEVLAELERRNEAKMVRNFDLADEIRELLLKQYNVAVDDRLREWSIGGDFGLKSKKSAGPFVRRGGGDLTSDEEADIAEMVEERDRAKKNRDFDTADEIRDILEARYSVKVDDNSKYT